MRTKSFFLFPLLLIGMIGLTGCKTNTVNAVKEYQCQGNSPFWQASISPKAIVFTLTGQDDLTFPYKAPQQGSTRTVFFTKTDDHTLRISLEKTSCRTSSAGQQFPYRVELSLDGKEYIGCGTDNS